MFVEGTRNLGIVISDSAIDAVSMKTMLIDYFHRFVVVLTGKSH